MRMLFVEEKWLKFLLPFPRSSLLSIAFVFLVFSGIWVCLYNVKRFFLSLNNENETANDDDDVERKKKCFTFINYTQSSWGYTKLSLSMLPLLLFFHLPFPLLSLPLLHLKVWESTYIIYKLHQYIWWQWHNIGKKKERQSWHDTAAERDRYLIELLEHSKMKVKL